MSRDIAPQNRDASGPIRRFVDRAAGAVRGLPSAALNLAFPPTCVGCGGEFVDGADGEPPFCVNCLEEFGLFRGTACSRCAAPLPITCEKASPNDQALVDGQPTAWVRPKSLDCVRCRGRRFWFQAATAAGRYTGRLRKLVLKMKRGEQDWISLAMGQLMWNCCGTQLAEAGVTVVVPVPLHWRRRFSHGTNSAARLAEVLAGHLRVPMAPRVLRRSRNTRPQFSLSTNERRTNVRGAFIARPGKRLTNSHVLLVDDIMTSGATCNEAARTLRGAGARRVTVAVVARAVPL